MYLSKLYSGYAAFNVALTSGMPYVLALKTLNHKIPKKNGRGIFLIPATLTLW